MDTTNTGKKGKVAYVLKNFPKLSETFIASEIYRLEQLGVDLKLLVIKPRSETTRHAVVGRIKSRAHHLPATASLTETSFARWLQAHLPDFWPSVLNVCKKNPKGFLQAAKFCVLQ